jgi:dTDP-4-dehydrorhamnose 3,5-epimerase-like enzyme
MEQPVISKPRVYVDHRGTVRRIADGLGFLVADIYSTTVRKNVVKGWHWYDTKIMSYVCLVGTVMVEVFDPGTQERHVFYLSDKDYSRIVISPGWWTALTGIDDGENVLVVCASETYNEKSVHNEMYGWE